MKRDDTPLSTLISNIVSVNNKIMMMIIMIMIIIIRKLRYVGKEQVSSVTASSYPGFPNVAGRYR
jgi:hypothetical protein